MIHFFHLRHSRPRRKNVFQFLSVLLSAWLGAGDILAAIAIDAATPVFVSIYLKTVTTAAFNPPNNSLLVAVCMGNGATAQNVTITMSNNGAATTWTNQLERDPGEAGTESGIAAIFTTLLASARTGMTVTMTSDSTLNAVGMQVYVITGHDTTDGIGAVGEGDTTTNNTTPTVLTTTRANSWVFSGWNDWDDAGLPESTDVEAAFNLSGDDGMSVRKSAATASSGTGVTMNFDGGGTGAVAANWVAVEVQEPAAAGGVDKNRWSGQVIIVN